MIWVVIVRMTCALSFACIIILCKSALYITYRALGVIWVSRVLKGTIENLNTECQKRGGISTRIRVFPFFSNSPFNFVASDLKWKAYCHSHEQKVRKKQWQCSWLWKSCVHKIIIWTLHTLHNTLLLWLQY